MTTLHRFLAACLLSLGLFAVLIAQSGVERFANNCATTLASAITNVATSMTVATGEGARCPDITTPDYFYVTLETGTTREIVQVTARAADVFTIERGQQGTAALAWSAGATVQQRVTRTTLETFQSGRASYVTLSSNQASAAATTYANLGDLSWPVAASTDYEVECHLQYSASATTIGLRIGWMGPASPTLAFGHSITSLSTTTPGMTTVLGNDTGTATTASAATTGNVVRFNGTWRNGSTAGTLQMRYAPETATASGITILANSWCKYSTF